jgi:hypothetical protein
MSDQETTLTCQQLLDNLNRDWKEYPGHFNQLDPDQQAAFLKEQGYASFHDLLAHILAWWEEAIKIVQSILDLEEIPRREYDIDDFNAAALDRFRTWKETDLISLVVDLPEGGLQNKRINDWLNACLVDHFHAHAILK